jgi:hypothetical protein
VEYHIWFDELESGICFTFGGNVDMMVGNAGMLKAWGFDIGDVDALWAYPMFNEVFDQMFAKKAVSTNNENCFRSQGCHAAGTSVMMQTGWEKVVVLLGAVPHLCMSHA